MTTTSPIRDQIAGLRAQASHHREMAKRLRLLVKQDKAKPFRERDPIARLKWGIAINERVRCAQDCDRTAATLRLQLGPTHA